jgi:uncharacterized protein RhaS with RHS repeats
MYFRFRMYDPATGRFISRDPLGYVDGMSLYLAYFVPDETDAMGLASDKCRECNPGEVRMIPDTVCEYLKCASPDRGETSFWEVRRSIHIPGCEWPQGETPGEAYLRGLREGAHDGALSAANGVTDSVVGTVTFGAVDGPDWAQNYAYDPNDPNLRFSRGAGYVAGVSLQLAITAGGAVNSTSQYSTVSHWGKNSKWVMNGGKNYLNYIKAGGRQLVPYRSGVQFKVPTRMLRYPSGWQRFKGVIGPRVLR